MTLCDLPLTLPAAARPPFPVESDGNSEGMAGAGAV